jgi:uncharacterized membrane-anchored protein YjiN (DUF445 family)
MLKIQTEEDIYPALDELIDELKTDGHSRLAAILNHRMRNVAWTTRSELFEELRNILTKALESNEINLSKLLKEKINQVLLALA